MPEHYADFSIFRVNLRYLLVLLAKTSSLGKKVYCLLMAATKIGLHRQQRREKASHHASLAGTKRGSSRLKSTLNWFPA